MKKTVIMTMLLGGLIFTSLPAEAGNASVILKDKGIIVRVSGHEMVLPFGSIASLKKNGNYTQLYYYDDRSDGMDYINISLETYRQLTTILLDAE